MNADKAEKARTTITKTIDDSSGPHPYDNLSGGLALKWMDEAAFIAATRFTCEKLIPVCCDSVIFKRPIPIDSVIEIDAQVKEIGDGSVDVTVCVYLKKSSTQRTQLAIKGNFVFVFLDEYALYNFKYDAAIGDGVGGIC